MLRVLRSTIVHAPIDSVWQILRDFNYHAEWHPAVERSAIERARAPVEVGCVRRFTLADGKELREQLLTLSDAETAYSYCLLDTPLPLFNYVAHSRLIPVTDENHTYWEWEARFDTKLGEERAMQELVGESIMQAGFDALKLWLSRQ